MIHTGGCSGCGVLSLYEERGFCHSEARLKGLSLFCSCWIYSSNCGGCGVLSLYEERGFCHSEARLKGLSLFCSCWIYSSNCGGCGVLSLFGERVFLHTGAGLKGLSLSLCNCRLLAGTTEEVVEGLVSCLKGAVAELVQLLFSGWNHRRCCSGSGVLSSYKERGFCQTGARLKGLSLSLVQLSPSGWNHRRCCSGSGVLSSYEERGFCQTGARLKGLSLSLCSCRLLAGTTEDVVDLVFCPCMKSVYSATVIPD